MALRPQRCSSRSGRSPATSMSSVPVAPSSTTHRSRAMRSMIRAWGSPGSSPGPPDPAMTERDDKPMVPSPTGRVRPRMSVSARRRTGRAAPRGARARRAGVRAAHPGARPRARRHSAPRRGRNAGGLPAGGGGRARRELGLRPRRHQRGPWRRAAAERRLGARRGRAGNDRGPSRGPRDPAGVSARRGGGRRAPDPRDRRRRGRRAPHAARAARGARLDVVRRRRAPAVGGHGRDARTPTRAGRWTRSTCRSRRSTRTG